MRIQKPDSVIINSGWHVNWRKGGEIWDGYPYHSSETTTVTFMLRRIKQGGFDMWEFWIGGHIIAGFEKLDVVEKGYIKFFEYLTNKAWVQALRPINGKEVVVRDWKTGKERRSRIKVGDSVLYDSDNRDITDCDWRIYKPQQYIRGTTMCSMCYNFCQLYYVPTIGPRCGPCVDKLMETLDFTVDL